MNYQKVKNESVSLNNYYIATEYSFIKSDNFTPYIGASIGSSELTWQRQPIDTTQNDLKSNSYVLGGTLGIQYKLNNEFSLNLNGNVQNSVSA